MLRIWMSRYTWGNSKAKGKSQKFNWIKENPNLFILKEILRKRRRFLGIVFEANHAFMIRPHMILLVINLAILSKAI